MGHIDQSDGREREEDPHLVVRVLLDRGDYLAAADYAEDLAPDQLDGSLRHLAVLALVRAGAVDAAMARYEAYGLDELLDDEDRELATDVAALRARLAKDRALAEPPGDRRTAALAEAAGAYQAIYERLGGYYPCINAATLWFLAGDPDRARKLAEEALDACRQGADYWEAATAAEAALILGRPDEATTSLALAAERSEGAYATRAVTRGQLLLLCQELRLDPAVLDRLGNPAVAHISATGATSWTVDEATVRAVRRTVRDRLEQDAVRFVFGSLQSGMDVVVAEVALAQGMDLHVVLPCELERVLAIVGAQAGSEWSSRIEACVEQAASVVAASQVDDISDPVIQDLTVRVAHGDARLRARFLASPFCSFSLTAAGTGVAEITPLPAPAPLVPGPAGGRQAVKAMLFADVAGFSRLTDSQIPAFMQFAMGALGEVLDDHPGVEVRNTWGDALYVVCDSVSTAAACALDLQSCWDELDLESVGLPAMDGLRIAGHVGPVFPGIDRVTGTPTYFGSAVVRAARIEPRTPVGEVFVTHAFAALTELELGGEVGCQYVGRVPTAKDYGTLPMYLLRRARLD